MQELTGFFSCTVREIFLRGSAFQQGLQFEDIFVKGSILFDTAQRVEVQMQIYPAPEGFFIPFSKTFFRAGILSGPGELLHPHNGDAVRIDIERAGTPGRTEFVKVAVQFFFDPLDAEFDQRDEIKVGVEQFGEILLGIIAIIRNDLDRKSVV